VQKAISRINALEISMVASTHGPVWRSRPQRAIELYDRWSRQEPEDGVAIVYASMYGNTEKVMEAISRALTQEMSSPVRVHNVSRSHSSFILSNIWRYKAIILGSPTYNMGLFPLMDHLLRLLENKGLKDRIVGIFGSYGWSGGAIKELTDFAGRMKWQVTEPIIEVKCSATEEDLRNCSLLGSNMAKRLMT